MRSARSTVSASNPIPASNTIGKPLHIAASTCRVAPPKIVSQAASIVSGSSKAAAKALAVPREIIPKGIFVLTKALAAADKVPSPPEAMIAFAP